MNENKIYCFFNNVFNSYYGVFPFMLMTCEIVSYALQITEVNMIWIIFFNLNIKPRRLWAMAIGIQGVKVSNFLRYSVYINKLQIINYW